MAEPAPALSGEQDWRLGRDRWSEISASLRLVDGTVATLREIQPDDAGRPRRLFHRRSPESVYRRFSTPIHDARPQVLEHFATVDHRRREAIVAAIGGEVVAVARYDQAEGTDEADTAVLVEDARQGRGLAKMLLRRMAVVACDRGIRTFTALILGENARARPLYSTVFTHLDAHLEGSQWHLRISLEGPDRGAAERNGPLLCGAPLISSVLLSSLLSMSAPPIAIDHLTKNFGGDVLAVDDLSLVIEEGQVFGLLGPNGAGKTTTLRTLLGLVHPSSGRARLFGVPVHSGAAELERVGALVESPGFVPHLSGLANLELFWRSGGRRLADADFDAALEVAGLGDALRRKYKTYSHGMRQRLGLAQALLGRPDVLVLDEPTSGLDPQQMREMREVVRRIAARGATVLLSSHLLGEVEQVCSHAAVMNRGRLVSAGTVAELTGSTTTVYLEVDDVGRARSVLEGLSGVSRIASEVPGLSIELNGVERKSVVAALVSAGVGVETVTSRHRLEDAFIEMLEAEPA